MHTRLLPIVLFTSLAAAGSALAQETEPLKNALGDGGVSDGWIYEDIEAGYAAAKKTGKPLLVAFR